MTKPRLAAEVCRANYQQTGMLPLRSWYRDGNCGCPMAVAAMVQFGLTAANADSLLDVINGDRGSYWEDESDALESWTVRTYGDAYSHSFIRAFDHGEIWPATSKHYDANGVADGLACAAEMFKN